MNAEQDLIDKLYKLQEENQQLKNDKASILKEVKDVWDYLYRQPGPGTYEGKITAAANTLESLLSKHESP